LPFRAVNRADAPGHDPGLQRHHLLPRQLLGRPAFARMFARLGGERRRFEDFRGNGLLLPCEEGAALRLALPMHRGPHRLYSELVIERVGQIEAGWAAGQGADPRGATVQARLRLDLLQGALRRYLLGGRRRRLRLNRKDPLGAGVDFAELDGMAEALWGATGVPVDPVVQAMPARTRRSSRAE
jgi:hypothetical protein